MLPALAQSSRLALQNTRLSLAFAVPRLVLQSRALSTPSSPPSPTNASLPTTRPLFVPRESPQIPRPPAEPNSTWYYLHNCAKKAAPSELSPEDQWAQRETRHVQYLARPQHAYSGRSIAVQNNNLGLAYNALQGTLRRNYVQYELRMSERHEKKGVKRRRLRSERWRRVFAHEVRKKVKLVQEIRARGA